MMLSVMSFQHTTRASSWGLLYYGGIPRQPTRNDPGHGDDSNLPGAFAKAYAAIAAANIGLRALAGGLEIPDEPGAPPEHRNRQARAEAFARYVQGISYGYLAILYDRAPVVDETMDLQADLHQSGVQYAGYSELLEAALSYLDQATAIASTTEFTVPTDWIWTPEPLSSAELARVASSYKARLRAAAARTPSEASAAAWRAVLEEIDAGVQADHNWLFDGRNRWNGALYYSLLNSGPWSWMPFFVYGMADQSGTYQAWLALGEGDWHPNDPDVGGSSSTPRTSASRGARRWKNRWPPRARGWSRRRITSAAGRRRFCVPKLPDSMEPSHNNGLMTAAFYFDSRRWGDLYEGTP